MAIGRRNWLALTFQNISRDAWNKHSIAAFGREMLPQYRCTLADSKADMLSTFEGATTPHDFSPCGVCIDNNELVMMVRPRSDRHCRSGI
jgi:hypothetical protein